MLNQRPIEDTSSEPTDLLQGWVFDIQSYSLNDGPGIRTTVFLKGCPLGCLWCDNPESQSRMPELLYLPSLCTNCQRCVAACPTGATTVGSNGQIQIDRSLCQVCGKCVAACLSEARVITGKLMSVEEVFQIVREDTLFYRNSGGGVTTSGGEPTSQPEFVRALFARCQEAGLHTTLDTCGMVEWKTLKGILEHVDLVLFDVKHMDTKMHKRLTGVGNAIILQNLERTAKIRPVIIRIPLIPGYNDSRANIEASGQFLSKIGVSRVDIAPYHRLGAGKYERLGRQYALGDVETCGDERVEASRQILESYGLEVSVA
ncbi:glycyl-radical enzyme activating protein [Chloroflexota bacterium]